MTSSSSAFTPAAYVPVYGGTLHGNPQPKTLEELGAIGVGNTCELGPQEIYLLLIRQEDNHIAFVTPDYHRSHPGDFSDSYKQGYMLW